MISMSNYNQPQNPKETCNIKNNNQHHAELLLDPNNSNKDKQKKGLINKFINQKVANILKYHDYITVEDAKNLGLDIDDNLGFNSMTRSQIRNNHGKINEMINGKEFVANK